MADWSLPGLSNIYSDFVAMLKQRDADAAVGFDPAVVTPTNLPTNTIRWNSASNKWEKWSGSAWGDLSGDYAITVNNADKLGGTPAASYALQSWVTGNYAAKAGSGSQAFSASQFNGPLNGTMMGAGNITAESSGTAGPGNALQLRGVYNDGYPIPYGNALHMDANGGQGQILIGWSGADGAHADNYVRSLRDNHAAWSPWAKIYTSANLTNVSQLTNDANYLTTSGTAADSSKLGGQLPSYYATASSVAAAVPSGTVLPFAGSAAPSGYLLCDGSPVSRSTYSALFNAIGTAFGAGDGSTTFNLPDSRGRAPIGAGTGSGLTARTLGASGGEENHTITTGEMPSHNHSASDSGHGHSINTQGWGGSIYNQSSGMHAFGGGAAGATDYVNNGWANISIGNNGGGGAHNNMQPFFVTNFIIKT